MATNIREDIRKDTRSKICQYRQLASNSDGIISGQRDHLKTENKGNPKTVDGRKSI
ncbi:MAG TPA: hypothetical protein VIY47_17055 [Ignavibacteriaceae bacterium]